MPAFRSQCQLNDKPKRRAAVSALAETLLVIKYRTSNNTTTSLPAIWPDAEKYGGQQKRRTMDCWTTAGTCACNSSQGFHSADQCNYPKLAHQISITRFEKEKRRFFFFRALTEENGAHKTEQPRLPFTGLPLLPAAQVPKSDASSPKVCPRSLRFTAVVQSDSLRLQRKPPTCEMFCSEVGRAASADRRSHVAWLIPLQPQYLRVASWQLGNRCLTK